MYHGIDLGEAISISGSKAMADKIMADKKADKASREEPELYGGESECYVCRRYS